MQVAAAGGRWRALRGPALVGAGAVAAVSYVALVDPHSPGHYLACPWLTLTGWYCAGCGGLRATHDLVHGDLAGAWGANPLWVITAPVLVLAWAAWLRRRWPGRLADAEPDGPTRPARPARATRSHPAHALIGTHAVRSAAPWLVLVVVVGFSVLRNVPALAPWLVP